jgi:undecaprenyl-diphosphatase
MNWHLTAMQRAVQLDTAICHQINRACTFRHIRRFFAAISWLGNGKFWYALILGLPLLFGHEGLLVSLQMAGAGFAGLLIYKLIKHFTHRPRPHAAHASIVLGAAPLDQFSFPSGHTLHAVLFTALVVSSFPALGWLLIPFMLLVAASRVILGLHYPTDVLLGAAIGGVLAWVTPLVFTGLLAGSLAPLA